MAKLKIPKKILNNTGFWIFLAVIAFCAFIYIWNPDITAIFNSVVGGGTTINLPSGDIAGDLPAQQSSCTQYNIYNEYVKYLGQANVNYVHTSCTSAGGMWTATNNEMGCGFPSTVTFDCNQDVIRVLGGFCTYLKATWTCDNTIHYIGCTCQTTPSALPAGSGQDGTEEQDTYTCGWHSEIWGTECGGTCPATSYCGIPSETSRCECISESQSWEVGDKGTIFVSKNTWNGAMGGITGADEKCQVSAQYGGLSGTWKAIVSDSTTNARDRFPEIPYYNMKGELVASGQMDLFDGVINNRVYIDEYMNEYSNYGVWTGSDQNGIKTASNCHNWGWVAENGTIGSTAYKSGEWLNLAKNVCSNGNKIYCVKVS